MSSSANRSVDYIPFGALLLLSYFPWRDPFTGFMMLAFLWPLLIGAVVWAIIVLLQSIKRGGKHLRGILIASGLVLLSTSLLFFIRIDGDSLCPVSWLREPAALPRRVVAACRQLWRMPPLQKVQPVGAYGPSSGIPDHHDGDGDKQAVCRRFSRGVSRVPDGEPSVGDRG